MNIKILFSKFLEIRGARLAVILPFVAGLFLAEKSAFGEQDLVGSYAGTFYYSVLDFKKACVKIPIYVELRVDPNGDVIGAVSNNATNQKNKICEVMHAGAVSGKINEVGKLQNVEIKLTDTLNGKNGSAQKISGNIKGELTLISESKLWFPSVKFHLVKQAQSSDPDNPKENTKLRNPIDDLKNVFQLGGQVFEQGLKDLESATIQSNNLADVDQSTREQRNNPDDSPFTPQKKGFASETETDQLTDALNAGSVVVGLVGGPALNGLTGAGPSVGGSWTNVATTFTEGLETIARASLRTVKSIENILDAVGLKQTQALTDKTRKELKAGKVNGDNLSDISTQSKNTAAEIARLSQEKLTLDAEQKKKISTASVEYFTAFVGASTGVLKLVEAKTQAVSAGVPGIVDGAMAIQVAKDIPVLTPKAIEFFKNSIELVRSIREFNKINDIATPDVDGLDGALGVSFS